METNRELAIRALENMRGDDLHRARLAFSGLSYAEMQEQHGMSGKTRAEILREYEEYDARITQAIEWLRNAYMR